MRFIMLDTETTGLSPANGDRMVEIGAIEVCHRQVNPDRVFHQYINPGRDIPQEVVRIHGIDNAKVKDCPSFADIASDFLQFIEGSTLVIHNAPFDLGFIMHELVDTGLPSIADMPVIDTLMIARKKYPHQRNNLNALCDRFQVERGHRELHGALLDSELLAEVYLAMTGGRQFSLDAHVEAQPASTFANVARRSTSTSITPQQRRPAVTVPEEDQQAHRTMMERIHQESNGATIWQSAS
ncbi:MAG: DNA polymerase III subunit epsilon [Mariprofundaceae bacterium]|nr:DNA polymerase III subunit epsilon [Mariprofundaceae bacterium]